MLMAILPVCCKVDIHAVIFRLEQSYLAFSCCLAQGNPVSSAAVGLAVVPESGA